MRQVGFDSWVLSIARVLSLVQGMSRHKMIQALADVVMRINRILIVLDVFVRMDSL